MRADFSAVLCGGGDLRHPDAVRRRRPVLDDDGVAVRAASSCRDLEKGWREGDNIRYGLPARFLRSRVGRPWNDVRAEICAAMPPGRLRDVVIDRVEVGCRFHAVEGVLSALGHPVRGLHADPRDGLLADAGDVGRNPVWKLRRVRRLLIDPLCVPLTDPRLDVSRRVELRNLDGHWFLLRFSRTPEPFPVHSDVRVGPPGKQILVGERLVSKRQANARLVRRLRLREWETLAAKLSGATYEGKDDKESAAALDGLLRTARRLCGT